MADVSFNEPQYRSVSRGNQKSAFANFVIKMGFAKTDEGAQKVLLVLAGLIVILAIGVYIYANPSSSNAPDVLVPVTP